MTACETTSNESQLSWAEVKAIWIPGPGFHDESIHQFIGWPSSRPTETVDPRRSSFHLTLLNHEMAPQTDLRLNLVFNLL